MTDVLSKKRGEIREKIAELYRTHRFDHEYRLAEINEALSTLPSDERIAWEIIGDSDPRLFGARSLIFEEDQVHVNCVLMALDDKAGLWPDLPPSERARIWSAYGKEVQLVYDLPGDVNVFSQWKEPVNQE